MDLSKTIRPKLAALLLFAAFTFNSCVTTGSGSSVSQNLPAKIDMTAWNYNEADDVYYQTGIPYVSNPADSKYETLGIFIPGKYMVGKKNPDGTYTLSVAAAAKVASHTGSNAPFVMPVETPGYSAANPPSAYSPAVKDYTDAGFIFVWSGARGREHGAPCGVADFKAAIRYIRYNKASLPGDTDSFFTYGMSGGGAQSALLGATGDSSLYTPYLEAIGAVMSESDAVLGCQAWCPVTNLNVADAAYEWEMGVTRTGLSSDARKLSNGLTAAFADYINGLNLKDEQGNVLSLQQSADSLHHAGSYYDYLKATIEDSLNKFLADTTFPYNPDEQKSRSNSPMLSAPGFAGGTGPAPGGADYAQVDSVKRTGSKNSFSISISGTYASAEEYIANLNSKGKWVAYDSASNTVKISSVEAFMRAVKNAVKSVGAFDDLNRKQGENTLFGYNDGKGAHFDEIEAVLLAGTEYEAAFAEDLAKTDSLGKSVSHRVDMYNPMYFLCKPYKGYKKSSTAKYWRIRSGIFQGDTAVSTELDLALALKAYGMGVKSVDFETVWGLGHVQAERSGRPVENFIAWVNACLK